MNPLVMQWGIRNGVSHAALMELRVIMGLGGTHTMPKGVDGVSEAAVASVLRLEASRKGVRLFRNNNGVLKDARGVPVRFGLANDSAAINKVLKSHDYIGWRSRLITPEMVGSYIAQFVSREAKKVGWVYTGDEHEAAQLAWLELVVSEGGDAAFATGEGTL